MKEVYEPAPKRLECKNSPSSSLLKDKNALRNGINALESTMNLLIVSVSINTCFRGRVLTEKLKGSRLGQY